LRHIVQQDKGIQKIIAKLEELRESGELTRIKGRRTETVEWQTKNRNWLLATVYRLLIGIHIARVKKAATRL
jgi:hypothetical protein